MKKNNGLLLRFVVLIGCLLAMFNSALAQGCSNTLSTINPDVCDTYTSPSGLVWTTSGIRNDTITNAAGCDSVITVNLTIRNRSFSTINPDVCDTYTSPSGLVWTTSGIRNDTITNAAGCDSVITVNLTIGYTIDESLVLRVDSNVKCYGGSDGGLTAVMRDELSTIIFNEGFENCNIDSITQSTTNISGAPGWSYVNVTGPGRLQIQSRASYVQSGNRSFTLDSRISASVALNYLIKQEDLSATLLKDSIKLAFWLRNQSDEKHSNDRVWIRGSSTDLWIEAYNWSLQRGNIWVQTTLDVSQILEANNQAPSSSFQIRFGQMDNYNAPTDGLSIDNVILSIAPPEITNLSSYSFAWSNNMNSSVISGIKHGSYYVDVTNPHGCEYSDTMSITEPTELRTNISETAYDSYISPSGRYTWTITGDYLDTISSIGPNQCDSILEIDLEIINIIYVDSDRTSSGNGNSWNTSFRTLDDAILNANASPNTVKIFVKKGIYYPGGNNNHSNRDTSFVLVNPTTHLLGGFSGVETDEDQRNITANPAILCGDIGKQGDSTDNSYHVLIVLDRRTTNTGVSIEDNFIIDGLTIQNGNANGSSNHNYYGKTIYQTEGAGIVVRGSGISNQEISPTIANCHIENNHGYYGSIFIYAPQGASYTSFQNCTFKGNATNYGTIYNDGSLGIVSPGIDQCAFDNNQSSTSGGAIYNYSYSGESSPTISNCVFHMNSASSSGGAIYNNGYLGTSTPILFNNTFVDNSAGSSGGAIYNFGSNGTCNPTIFNSIFYGNNIASDTNHKFSEFYNYQSFPTISYSSMQLASSSYTTSTLNHLGGGTNNYHQNDPKFMSVSDPDGADNVWRTADDGLQLSGSSVLMNAGTNTGASATDILGSSILGIRDMGAYEYIACGLNVQLATDVATHTASQAINDGDWTCYCNANNELLLAIDTNGTGAVIMPSQVKLYIGNPSTLSYNTSGGMITNTNGGVVLERRWDVDPTTQPSSEVGVRYFYTNDDYNDIVTAMAGLSSPTTVSSPSQLQFFKVKGGSTANFPNPHDTGVYGIILSNGTTADTNVWVAGVHGVQDHSAEYLVSSFSGGGGGGGGGSAPLPVELIQFNANAQTGHTAQLDWTTATELNNDYFVIERSYNAREFEPVDRIDGAGNSQHSLKYGYLDNTIAKNQNTVFYRLKQVDFDGTEAYSPIRKIDFNVDLSLGITVIYPNPTSDQVNLQFDQRDDAESHQIRVMDNIGKVLMEITSEDLHVRIDLSNQPTGLYFITIDTGETFKVIRK